MRKQILFFVSAVFFLMIFCVSSAFSKDKKYYIERARILPAIDKYFSENPPAMDDIIVGDAGDVLCPRRYMAAQYDTSAQVAACKKEYRGMEALTTEGMVVTVLFKNGNPELLQPEAEYLLYKDYCQNDRECHQTCDKKGNCEMINWYYDKPAHEAIWKENVRYYCKNERCQREETPTVSTSEVSKEGEPYFIDIGTVIPGETGLLYKEFKDTKSGIIIITPSSDFDMGDYVLENDKTIQVRYIGKDDSGITRVVYPYSLIYDIELEKKLYDLQNKGLKIANLFFSSHFEDVSGAYIQVGIAHPSPCETIEADTGKGGVLLGCKKGKKETIMQQGQLVVTNWDGQDDKDVPNNCLRTELNGHNIEFNQQNQCVCSNAQCCQQRMEETRQIIKQIFDIP